MPESTSHPSIVEIWVSESWLILISQGGQKITQANRSFTEQYAARFSASGEADCWRNIAISLIDPRQGVLSEIA
jgi:hypothetical protein